MSKIPRAAKRETCFEELVYLELLRTSDVLSRGVAEVLKGNELSLTQYNVLRILRGTPEGLPCGEIGNRMITRDPDVTRLLDRLERRKLIQRARHSEDRRTVMAQITREGLNVLAKLDEPIVRVHRAQLGHLGAHKLREFVELLSDARNG